MKPFYWFFLIGFLYSPICGIPISSGTYDKSEVEQDGSIKLSIQGQQPYGDFTISDSITLAPTGNSLIVRHITETETFTVSNYVTVDKNETTQSSTTVSIDEPTFLTARLQPEREQLISLIDPLSKEFTLSTETNRYIKLNVEFIEGSENGNHDPHNGAKYVVPLDLRTSKYLKNRGKAAQRLARESCIAIVLKDPNGIHKKTSNTATLPSSCADALTREWETRRSNHPLTVQDQSALHTMICQGVWVPRGGNLNDLTQDSFLPFPNYSDSIAFHLSPTLLKAIAMLLKDSIAERHFYEGVNSTLKAKDEGLAAEKKDEWKLVNKIIDRGNPNLLQFGYLSQREFDDNVRICFFPSLRPAQIYDVGSLNFISPPILAPIYRRTLRTPVRIFLNPGWSLDVPVEGLNFTKNENLLSLKLNDCSGFPDSMSFRSSHPTRIRLAADQVSFSSELSDPIFEQQLRSSGRHFDEGFFSFSADFKVEESDLHMWHLRYLDRFSHRKSVLTSFQSNLHPITARRRLRSKETATSSNLDVIIGLRLCFFAHHSQLNGTDLGTVSFYSDHEDSAELVGFIIFAIIGVPFTCGLTLSCYSYRHRKLRKRLRRLRLVQQRDEIERRLLDHLGFDRRSVSSSEDEDPHETSTQINSTKMNQRTDSNSRSPPLLTPQEVQLAEVAQDS